MALYHETNRDNYPFYRVLDLAYRPPHINRHQHSKTIHTYPIHQVPTFRWMPQPIPNSLKIRLPLRFALKAHQLT